MVRLLTDRDTLHAETPVAYKTCARVPQEALSAQLTGERVRLWPYAPGVGYPPTQLYAVWDLFERENLWRRVFYQRDTPEDLRALEHFLPWWDQRHVLLVEDLHRGGLVDLGGIVWFDELTRGLRANINIAYARRLWGAPCREATRLACAYAFRHFELRAIWGLTPWPAATRHGLACGFRLHTTLPDWVMRRGKPMPLSMIVAERQPTPGRA
jgi:hypothetical protein